MIKKSPPLALLLATLLLAACGGGSGSSGAGDDTNPPGDNPPFAASWVEVKDEDGDSVTDVTTETAVTFDAANEVVAIDSSTRRSDGSLLDQATNKYTDGHATEMSYAYDQDGDGVLDVVYKTLRPLDAAGNLLEWVDEEWDGNGVLQRRIGTSYTYDAQGHEIAAYREDDNNGDGVAEYRYENAFVYTDGLLTSDDHRIYSGTADTPNYVAEGTYEYDAQGRETKSTRTEDSNADGVNDVVTTRETTYNTAGAILSQVETRVSGDTSVQSHTYTYDAQGRQISGNYSYDSSSAKYGGSFTNTYDAAGNVASTLQDWDGNGDGVVDSVSRYEYTYDAQGRMLTETYKSNISGETYASLDRTSYAYDTYGIELTTKEESDTDGNGVIDEVSTWEITRDAQGRPVSKIYTLDEGNDGTLEESSTVTATWSSSLVTDEEFLENYVGWYY